MEEGVFHESANFASLHKLPILFVCENNRFSCFTTIEDRQPSEDFTRLAKCHNIKSQKLDGNDVLGVYNNSSKILKSMKKISQPFFLQLDTYRFVEHCGPNSDDFLEYRNSKELKKWMNKDPVEEYEEFNRGFKKNNDQIKH